MGTSNHLLPRELFHAAAALLLAVGATGFVVAQDGAVVPVETGSDPVIPTSYSGSGSFFNRQLGTAFRINYHTESYGTNEGIVSLGAMKVFNHDNAVTFLDGQGTMSDEFGGGFNAGIGYRWMHDSYFYLDPQRISGASFWTDGQSTQADNFFTQLGVTLESLGDRWDFRGSGYFPLDRTLRSDTTVTAMGVPAFLENNLVSDSIRYTVDTALTVVDGEIARRISNLEAWAFVGGYHMEGGSVDTEGYRAGCRGYALPDLAVSLQVTDDEIYHTNVVFGITWFVGRTNRSNAPGGTLVDRFREPVMRNNFIATTQRVISGAGGEALTAASTGDVLEFVHVDSSASAGGDGTIENPVNSLADAETIGAADGIIFVHSGSTLAGQITLKDGQQFLGEGGSIVRSVDTTQLGAVNLPESSVGASAGTVPIINGVGDVFTLADNNAINNFTVNGGTRAVWASAVAAPRLGNLTINNPTGDAIVFTDVTGTPIVENTVTINSNTTGAGMVIDGGDASFNPNANIINSAGRAIIVRNRTGGTITYGGDITGTGAGILFEDNSGGTIEFSAASDVNLDVTGTNNGLTMENNTGATITFNDLAITSTNGDGVNVLGGGTLNILDTNSTSTIANSGTGTAVRVVGDANASATGDAVVAISADIANSGTGRSIDVRQMTAGSVTINSTVSDTGTGVNVQDNTGGAVLFANTLTLNTGTSAAVTLANNTGATIDFNGLDIDTTSGTGFLASGGGTLSATGTNTIQTTTGTGLSLDGMTIAAAGVGFGTVSVNGAANGVVLNGLTGGQVTVGSGSSPGDGGSLTTTGDAIRVTNTANANILNVTVANAGGNGVTVSHTDANVFDLEIDGLTVTAATGVGVAATANGSGVFNLLLDGSTIGGVGQEGVLFSTGASSTRVNLTMTSNSIVAGDNVALKTDLALGSGDVRFLLQGNTITNDSAANATADLSVASGLTLNATISSQNLFTNNNAASNAFAIDVNHASGTINLDLRNNTGASGGGVQFLVTETTGDFNIVDVTNTINDLNNIGTVDIGANVIGDFDNFIAPVLTPSAP